MLTFKHNITLVTASLLALASCSAEDELDSEDRALLGDAVAEHESLEQLLDLIPQAIDAVELSRASTTLDGSLSRYVILSTDAGGIDLESIGVAGERSEPSSLTELFSEAPPAQVGLLERDALLLLAVPDEHIEELCERFQFGYDDGDMVITEGEQLLYRTPAVDGLAHALCLLPLTSPADEGADEEADGAARADADPSFDLVAEDDPQAWGSGSYTVWVKTLTCNDPRDWENWPYNGDETRMRAFRDGIGGDQIWSSNDVESGDSFSPGRYIHFNANAKIEIYDYDSGFWNANDKLGQEWIYSAEACGGDHYGDFDGSGGGHDWNYDLTYQVFGPGCTCQSQRPAIYSYSQVETCSVTSQSITNYTYYCSGGTQYKQAWGNVTRHCQTNNKKYNTSCELNTYVSQQLMSECDKYQYGVAIGGPVNIGACPGGGGGGGGECGLEPYAQQAPSYEDQLHSNEELPQVEPLIQPEPICPML